MLRRLLRTARSILHPPTPRVPNPRASDIYLVSYPKSGNTWMRYLLAYSIWPELAEIDLEDMAAYIPSHGIPRDAQMLLDPSAPCNQLPHRIVKEHFCYGREAQRYARRAIYIARDGRDALVSYWHFCNQRDGTQIPFSDFIELSARPGHSYGRWKDHVSGWLNAPLDAKLVIRYEDLLTDAAPWLERALQFAGHSISADRIEAAVARASFDSMKRLETRKGLGLEQLKPVTFVRSGKSGSWRETFGPGDLERFERSHGYGIAELGYNES